MSSRRRGPEDRSGLVSARGLRVFARDRGPEDGPCVVLLHDLFTTHFAYRNVMAELEREARVLALDLPGAGDSDRPPPSECHGYDPMWLAEVVHSVLAEREIGEARVVGQGFGGAVALELGAEAPALAKSLLLLAPFAFPVALPGRLSAFPALGVAAFRWAFGRRMLRAYLEQGLSAPELLDDRALGIYWDRLGRRGGHEAAFAMIERATTLDHLRDRLPGIDVPAIVAWGDRDRMVGRESVEQLVTLLPDARLHVVEGCGHHAPEERPEAVVDLVRQLPGLRRAG